MYLKAAYSLELLITQELINRKGKSIKKNKFNIEGNTVDAKRQ